MQSSRLERTINRMKEDMGGRGDRETEGMGRFLLKDREGGHIKNLEDPFGVSLISVSAAGEVDYIIMQHEECRRLKTQMEQILEKKMYALHRHIYYELLYVSYGEMVQRVEGRLFTGKKGSFCLLDRNTMHLEESLNLAAEGEEKQGAEIIYLCISRGLMKKLLEPMRDKSGVLGQFYSGFVKTENENLKGCITFEKIACTEKQDAMIADILWEMYAHEPGYEMVVQGYLLRLLSGLCEETVFGCALETVRIRKDSRLAESVMCYLRDNRRRITRKELTERFHYNEDYLSRVVRKYTGVSLKNYMEDLLLEEAEHLLLTETMSVNEIMKRLGYDNETFFYQLFNKRHHMTPVEYRKKVGK